VVYVADYQLLLPQLPRPPQHLLATSLQEWSAGGLIRAQASPE